MEGESVDHYCAALKTLDIAGAHEDFFTCPPCQVMLQTACPSCTSICNVPAALQELRIRDRLICGLRNKEMQRKVLAESYSSTLTLEKVLSICIAIENSNSVGDSLSAAPAPTEALAASKSTYKRQQATTQQQQSNWQQGPPHPPVAFARCKWCGADTHARETCPALNAKCEKCGRNGHFAQVCLSWRRKR